MCALIVVEEANLPSTDTILIATYATIGLSGFAHGITAAPLSRRYADWYASHPRDTRQTMECIAAASHRARGG